MISMMSAILLSLSSYALDFKLEKNRGGTLTPNDLKGKTLLVTNIATHCGLTPQLDKLEALHKKYKDKGLVVIGVPSDDFGGQSPGKDQDIAKFCKLNHGVTFTLLKKSKVIGDKGHPLFLKLKEKTGEAPNWNFGKYLISKDHKSIRYFGPRVSPDSKEVATAIQSLL